jgi:hypothetical protein
MSVFVEGNGSLFGYSNAIRQNYYMSNYYTLVDKKIFIEFKNPINQNFNQNFYLSAYLINFGDDDNIIFSTKDKNFYTYKTPGTYFVSYTGVYVDVFINETQLSKIQNSFSNINQIILNNQNVPITTPSVPLTNRDSSYIIYNIAGERILQYKSQLQLQVVEYAKYNFPSAMGNNPTLSAKCFRDMGYIIDAISADIKNKTNHRSIEIGSMYFQTSLIDTPFSGSSVPTLPQSEVPATIACIKILENYISGIDIPTEIPSFTDVGILSSTETGSDVVVDVSSRIEDVVFPLENNGNLNQYDPIGNPSPNDIKVADIIIANKTNIQNKMATYVANKGYLSNTTLASKCNRDVGLILDAVAHDLRTGVNSRSIQYGLAYWEGNTSKLKESNVLNHKQKTVEVFEQTYNELASILAIQASTPTIYTYVTEIPFEVKPFWNLYDSSEIRLNDEINLNLPYSLEDIEIQPNEWAVEDIFNTSILRLQNCLDYLNTKTQTINTFAPTIYFGWLGNNSGNYASVLKWYTKTFNKNYLNAPEISKSNGSGFFKNIIDIDHTTYENYGEILGVIDNDQVRMFLNEAIPQELFFTLGDSLSSILIKPISIAFSEDTFVFYVCDQIKNSIYKILITPVLNEETQETKLKINLQLSVGGFGGLDNKNNFNTPTEMIYESQKIYVLDYNNFGIKSFNKDLNWIYTYYIQDFDTNRPISITALKNGLLYVLTQKSKVFIFDENSNDIFESFDIIDIPDSETVLKITTDKENNFIYILSNKSVYKYTLSGSYVTTFVIPKNDSFEFTSFKSSKDQILFISSKNFIIKCQDILQIFKLNQGLPQRYWSKKQLSVDKNEFIADYVYNRSFAMIHQNILNFRDSLNAQFVIANEYLQNNSVSYFSYIPVFAPVSLPIDNITNNDLIGVNELNIPSILNRRLKAYYDSLLILADFLSIKNYIVKNEDCDDGFCWSWDATSCYKLKLPVLKTCTINPISYEELNASQVGTISYVKQFTWEQAKSKCCKKQ